MSTSLWFRNPRSVFQNELRNFFGGGDPWMKSAFAERQSSGVFPLVNIYDDGESFMIRAEMPGVDKDSLDISCKNDQVIIRGERVLDAVEGEANFHRREREAGTFRRALTLPEAVNNTKVSANYDDGILQVYAPRAEEAKARKIEVK